MNKRAVLPRGLLAIMLGFAVLVTAAPLIIWFRLDYYEVCASCARKRDVQEWLIPFTRHAYYRYALELESPLSEVLEDLRLVDDHAHDWLLVHGEGPGSREFMGEGYPVAQGLITPAMGDFVRLLHRHLEKDELGYWFARMTHPQHAYVVRNIADQMVQESYVDAETFRARLRQVGDLERSMQRFRLGLTIDEPEARTPPRLLYQRSPR